MQSIWIEGRWQASAGSAGFRAEDPQRGEPFGPEFAIATRDEALRALAAACAAAPAVAAASAPRRAGVLEHYAQAIESSADALSELAHRETGLPREPRLRQVELPRTVNQLRQAARAAREHSWTQPTIDTAAGLRSCYAPLGKPVLVFGPNNFPLAFNALAGSDFASAWVAGNPVLAKGHPSQPNTTHALAKLLEAALQSEGFPPAAVQLIDHLAVADGLALAADPRLGAIAFTGSRAGGLALKAAADAAGTPSYFELSSVNPVIALPGALRERAAAIAEEWVGSFTLGAGQFCTKPGILFACGERRNTFVDEIARRVAAAPAAVVLNRGVHEGLQRGVARWCAAGAQELARGLAPAGPGLRASPQVLHVSLAAFFARREILASEVFGPVALLVEVDDAAALPALLAGFEGQLCASIYSARDGSDEARYADIAIALRARCGRLLDDKMPTGVAVSAAMNHGGPYPATGHPGFTSVGLPAAIRRFAALHSYDAVRADHLPPLLRDRNPGGVWRCVDGRWHTDDLS